jgi:hypothetical protein
MVNRRVVHGRGFESLSFWGVNGGITPHRPQNYVVPVCGGAWLKRLVLPWWNYAILRCEVFVTSLMLF